MTVVTGYDVAFTMGGNQVPIPNEQWYLLNYSASVVSLTDYSGNQIDLYGSFNFEKDTGTLNRIVYFRDGEAVGDFSGLSINVRDFEAAQKSGDNPFQHLFDGDDQFTGSTQSDSIVTYTGDDSILGRAGDDTLNAGEGDDYALGQDGNDQVIGEGGHDLLGGGPGNDLLDGGNGPDGLDGGDGDDILLGRDGNDRMIADDGSDQLVGAGGDDLIGGGAGNDGLSGGDGNDVIDGSDNGNDAMDGSSGDDILALGIGNDYATGGAGADLFYLRFGGVGQDTITDFYPGGGDHLHNDTTVTTEQLIASSLVTDQGTLITLAEGDTVLVVGASGIDHSWFA